MTRRLPILAVILLLTALNAANATVAVGGLFSDHTVLQRDKPCPVWGTAAPSKTITVVFNGQTKTTTSDAQGNWRLSLDAMAAKATAGNMTITESGANTITVTDVVVGDVWMCGGQSNMAYNLGVNADGAYTGIRWMWVNTGAPFVLADPWRNITSTWNTYTNISGFSAVAYYFARKIYLDQSSNIPIGLIGNSVGGTRIDVWLIQEGLTDIPVLAPLYSQPILPGGPFCLANNLTHPVSPFAIKGLIWYQGENAESTNQSPDSYFLKEKGLYQGFKRLFGLDDFAMYVVLLANWTNPPTNATPDLVTDNWADVRIQQTNVLGLQHGGAASAMDIGDAVDIHPADKLDVGERLALWALKNDYGRTSILPSGPVLRDVTVTGNKVTCSFDYLGSGLMVGYKSYTPGSATQQLVGGVLKRFSIADAGGTWYDATATIVGSTVEVTSSVSAPKRIAYAMWNNPKDGLDPTTLKEGLLYNVEGLPAAPFYLDDVSAKYTVTATAGANGSISPAGVTTYLKRKTALYSITPNSSYYIQDVTVDGVSVGAVKYYTFDPLYANHTIGATFALTAPNFTVTSSASSGGSISPLGAQTITQGGSQTFNITPNSGAQIAGVTVNGKPMGKRTYFTFSDVRINHTISTSFVCTINAQGGYGGTISPAGATDVAYGSNQTYTIAANTGFSISKVTVDGVSQGVISSYTFTNVTVPHTIAATFIGSGGAGDVPQQSQIIFSSIVDSLPAGGSIGSWPTYIPSGQSLSPLGTPTVTTIDGRKFAHNVASESDGFNKGSYTSPIACNGASIVVVAKPTRSGIDANWQAIVDVFYDRLVLGVMTGSGMVYARSNGTNDYSTGTIPDGQTTILSLVAQPDGSYKVWANGVQMMSNGGNGAMTALTPSGTSYITLGRNYTDTWSTFNGEIGDVFLYKTALSDADRVKLETYMANRLAYTGPTWTITASSGANGSINPAGAITVNQGATQTFSMIPNGPSYGVGDVLVDGASVGAVSSYTFTNVQANHTISVSWVFLPTYTLTASAGTGGTCTPAGVTTLYKGQSQTYTITPSIGYAISQVAVDGANQGAISSYTFSNVQANHTISAAFVAMANRTITASAGANGTITPSGAVSVQYGASQSFTFTPNTGYQVATVTVDGVSQGDILSYTFTNVIANHTINVTFAVLTPVAYYQFENNVLDTMGTYNGTAYNGPTYVPGKVGSYAIQFNGTNQYVSINRPISDSWSIAFWIKTTQTSPTGNQWYLGNGLVDGEVGGITDDFGVSYLNNKVAFGVGNADTTIQSTSTINSGNWVHVACTRDSLTGQMKVYINGTLETTGTGPTGTKNVPGTLHFGNLQTNINYFSGSIDQVKIYKSVISAADIAALANESSTNYTITSSAGAGGSISPVGSISVGQGNNQAFTITPNTGYAISQVTVDGVNQGAIATYTFTNVQANHTISAAFVALPTYTITASAGANGTISPSGAVSVYQGSNQTFTFTPDTGYVPDQVTHDGVTEAAGTGYTFTNVQAAHTISVTFKVTPTYTITASAAANGTISPSGPVIVTHGSNKTFTITPNSGYCVSALIVDGSNVGALTTYTFSNVRANHTISAAFASGTGLPSGTVACWPFDNTLNDSSANANTLKGTSGTVAYGPAKFGSASLYLNGSTTLGTLSGSFPTGVPTGANPYTVAAWIKADTGCSLNGGWIGYGNNATSQGNNFRLNGGTNNVWEYWFNNDFGATLASGNFFDGWHSVVGTWDGTTEKMYLDGIATTRSPNPTGLNVGTSMFIVGKTTNDANFKGWVNDLLIVNRALSAAEVAAYQTNGAGSATVHITASSASGGTIFPIGDVIVPRSGSQVFAITPNAGYAIASVLIDGVNNPGAVSSGAYTFTNVTAAHTISATFAKPLGVNNKTVRNDSKLVGRVVKVWGKVKIIGSGTFEISDGYWVNVTIAGSTAGLDTTKTVVVTGTVNADKSVTAQTIQIF